MENWQLRVRAHFEACTLCSEIGDDVIAELAAHLEENYEQARSQGLDHETAITHTLQEAGDWHVLAAEITRARSKENCMNHRTRSLWLPALITLLLASTSLAVTQFAGLQPRLVWVAKMGMTFYWPWLASLPLFGATGAYLSRRSDGPTRVRLAAGLAPALVMLIVMCLILPWGLAIDGFDFFRLVSFGLGLINWVAIPGAALLLGALPLLRSRTPGIGELKVQA